jgi:hypothetical protein
MSTPSPALTAAQIEQFIVDGYVRLDHAFPADIADECRAILWSDTGCDPADRTTWTRPVIRLGNYAQPPFRAAVNTPSLHAAFDQLVGPGRWQPQFSLGTFPVRFPSPDDPGDAGWHIDPSFGWDDDPADFLAWRANITSRGRALLMLFLLSDVGPADAPTRIRVGSHLDIARQLAPFGEAGLSLRKLAADDFAGTAHCHEALATGAPGTVYLCHPFLVHAGQRHHGDRVRFMAQPPLLPAEPLRLDRADGEHSPVERAIRRALGR